MKRVPHINSRYPEATGQSHRRRSPEVAAWSLQHLRSDAGDLATCEQQARAMKSRRPRKADESLTKERANEFSVTYTRARKDRILTEPGRLDRSINQLLTSSDHLLAQSRASSLRSCVKDTESTAKTGQKGAWRRTTQSKNGKVQGVIPWPTLQNRANGFMLRQELSATINRTLPHRTTNRPNGAMLQLGRVQIRPRVGKTCEPINGLHTITCQHVMGRTV